MKKMVLTAALVLVSMPTVAALMCDNYGDARAGYTVCHDTHTGESVMTIYDSGVGFIDIELEPVEIVEQVEDK